MCVELWTSVLSHGMTLRLAALGLVLLASTGVGGGAGSHYVSPSGSSAGDGTLARPWDLATALGGGGGRVAPGDTIWLRGGTYRGAVVSSVQGAPGAPVVVRQYRGERAVIDAAGATSSTRRGDLFVVTGDYAVYWGFELMDSDPDRTTDTRPNMVVNDASHTRYVNLIVHDGGIGFYTYAPPVDVEVSGCLFYNNGTLSAKSGAANILVGGRARADAIVAQDNLAYFSPGVPQTNAVFGWRNALGVRNGTLTLSRNYLVGGNVVLDLHAWERSEVSHNTLYGPGARPVVALDATVPPLDATNQVLVAPPSQAAVFVRPNVYEAGRANVVVYNWARQDTVAVALSGVLRRGDRYAVYNVQDFFGASVAGGVYAGEAVRIPMQGVAPPAPIGGAPQPPPPTGSAFGVFVVMQR